MLSYRRLTCPPEPAPHSPGSPGTPPGALRRVQEGLRDGQPPSRKRGTARCRFPSSVFPAAPPPAAFPAASREPRSPRSPNVKYADPPTCGSTRSRARGDCCSRSAIAATTDSRCVKQARGSCVSARAPGRVRDGMRDGMRDRTGPPKRKVSGRRRPPRLRWRPQRDTVAQ